MKVKVSVKVTSIVVAVALVMAGVNGQTTEVERRVIASGVADRTEVSDELPVVVIEAPPGVDVAAYVDELVAQGRLPVPDVSALSTGGTCAVLIVVVVGGYIVYRLVRFCQQKFPRPTPPLTNPPPVGVVGMQTEPPVTYTASLALDSGCLCTPEDKADVAAALLSESEAPQLIIRTTTWESNGVPQAAITSSQVAQMGSREEFVADLAGQGVDFLRRGYSYGEGTNTVTANEFPVGGFYPPVANRGPFAGASLYVAQAIEASSDLRRWERVFWHVAPVGVGVEVTMPQSRQAAQFYRVRVWPYL